MTGEILFQADNIGKTFGGLKAVDNVSFALRAGIITALVGPNGAGKTTFFNCVTGQLGIDAGRVVFAGDDLTNRPPEAVARAGIARTFQIVKVFKEMTVLDNVMVGAFLRERRGNAARARASAALDLVGLASHASALAGDLPIALQKRLELARAAATGPRLIVLDEALSGLTPAETQDALAVLRTLRERGIALLVVEHVMEVIMSVSDRVVVLDRGKRIAEGPPGEIAHDARVIEAYLGA